MTAQPPDDGTAPEPPALMARISTALSVLAIIAFIGMLRFAQDVIPGGAVNADRLCAGSYRNVADEI